MSKQLCVSSVDELVVAQSQIQPNAVALSFGSHRLTYQDLNDRAELLATMLRNLGIGSGAVVGVCAPRSPAMVIGCLAIMKVGAAFLPLDPHNPAPRLTFMAEDAQTSALIIGPGGENRIPCEARPSIDLDNDGRVIGARTPPSLLRKAAPKELAYIIYTSGSTGDPNGVEVTHQNLLNLVAWHQHAFHVTPNDRASQIASVGFDAAVWEIWPYLAAGACVHIPDEEVIRDPESLRNWLVAEGITITFVSTPMAEILLGLSWPAGTALRKMLIGADTLHRYPPTGLPFELINNYGPTECTVVATSGRILADGSNHGLPPIGRPIANTHIYILDESGRPVPAGTEGELYIGGAGVARGYLNRPELTAKRFVHDPFVAGSGHRLFKTGDIAKFLPDGQIAFVRRADDQIKVRGFRIEPSEITAALNKHSHVGQSCVVARQAGSGERHLVGYLVLAPESTLTPSELRDFLRGRLPDYMVPETFVKLDKLPLSANGKVHRAALPEPSESNILRDHTFTAPRNDLEKTVAGILGSLLDMEQVDVTANFFALGGHSLVGAQLIARVRREFQIEMSLRVLFETPTVAELSLEIERLLALKAQRSDGHAVPSGLESTAHPKRAHC